MPKKTTEPVRNAKSEFAELLSAVAKKINPEISCVYYECDPLQCTEDLIVNYARYGEVYYRKKINVAADSMLSMARDLLKELE